MQNPKCKFPNKLRELRREKHPDITRYQFAVMLDLNPSSYKNWELGYHRPQPDLCTTLCSYYKKREDEIWLNSKLPKSRDEETRRLNSPDHTIEQSLPTAKGHLEDRASLTTYRSPLKRDWGEAPDVSSFYGRQAELVKLTQWLVTDNCRLVGILGIGGIGKTVLATKLTGQIQTQFDYIIWRSLLNAPTVESILGECILFLSDQQGRDLPESTDKRILLLIDYFRKYRCLLVLDNFEAILKGGTLTGHYRDGYEKYGNLIQQVGEMQHQSCVLLTSREKLKELALAEGEISSVRSVRIEGLSITEGKEILQQKGLFGTSEIWESLVNGCTGNPLILKIVSGVIQDAFGGDIASFLKTGVTISDDVSGLLDQQFDRLSKLEQDIILWLAIEREVLVLDDLQEEIVLPITKRELQEALVSLRRRYLIEKNTIGFTLQNVVIEYITDRFVNQICQEIITETIFLFKSHALIKASAKNYVRESQTRLILKPIAEKLLTSLGKRGTEEKLKRILSKLRDVQLQKPEYAAGNILNLLVQLQSDIRGWNFSYVTVWQAYLQGIALPEVNFVHSNFAKSVFSETFDRVISVSFSPNGKLLAGGTTNNEIRLWSTNDSTPLLVCQGHTDWIWSVAFSPDENLLASGSGDRTIRLWNVSTGQCLNILRGHSSWVRSVAFSPDGRLLASGSEDQTVRLWDARTGQLLMTLRGHTDRVLSVSFSPHGKIVASSSDDQTVRLWNINIGQCLMVLQGHTNRVYSVAFSPDGKVLASGSEDQTVRLWDARTGQCERVLYGHTNRIRSVAFSPDGRLLASGSEDQTVRLWDFTSGKYITTLYGHTSQVWPIAFSPDGKVLASGSEDQTVRLWDANTGQCLTILQGYVNQVRSIAFSPDGKLLASGSDDQAVRLWDINAEQCLATLRGHINQVWSVAFSPDGKLLASGSYDQTVRMWDINTRQCLDILHGHTNRVRSIAFDPRGELLASSGEDQTVRLWDIGTRQCLATLPGHTSRVRSVAFSPDGKFLASSGDDQTVRLWDINTRQCLDILHGHTNRVRSVAFSPDGKLLASGSEDQTVRLWNTKTVQNITVLRGYAGEVWSVAFSPDGKLLASSSYDGTIELWDLLTGQFLKMLKSDRPYERMNITGIQGLLEAQKITLKSLGAIEDKEAKYF